MQESAQRSWVKKITYVPVERISVNILTAKRKNVRKKMSIPQWRCQVNETTGKKKRICSRW